MGVNSTLDEDVLTLTATVLSRDGKQSIQGACAVKTLASLARSNQSTSRYY